MPNDTNVTTPSPVPPIVVPPSTGTTLNPALQRLQTRMDGAPQKLNILFHEVQVVAVPVGELRDGIAANPNHPKARDFAKAIQGLSPQTVVGVEQPDIQAMIQNRSVQHSTFQIEDSHLGPRTIRTKQVV